VRAALFPLVNAMAGIILNFIFTTRSPSSLRWCWNAMHSQTLHLSALSAPVNRDFIRDGDPSQLTLQHFERFTNMHFSLAWKRSKVPTVQHKGKRVHSASTPSSLEMHFVSLVVLRTATVHIYR
jgi:hypothetical protein